LQEGLEDQTAFRGSCLRDASATAPVLQEGLEAKTAFRGSFLRDASATAPVWQEGRTRPIHSMSKATLERCLGSGARVARRPHEANTAFRRPLFKVACETAPVLQEGLEAKTAFRGSLLRDASTTAPVLQEGPKRPTRHFEDHVLGMPGQRRPFCKKDWKPRQPSEGHC
jgi:hypothetical protein